MNTNLQTEPTNANATEETWANQHTEKVHYEPPSATFVPLKMEERLCARPKPAKDPGCDPTIDQMEA